MKFNFKLIDGTVLNQVILTTTYSDFRIGELHTKEEFENWFNSDGTTHMYFGGRYVQGGISHPKIIKSYEIIENDDEHTCTLICDCGKVYDYVPKECKNCGKVFVD